MSEASLHRSLVTSLAVSSGTPLPPLDADGHLYVFGYGSLIWRPGFPHEGLHPALLRGFHRRFCLWSRQYRGTPEVPGLVLGLDRGGACRGVAFRVAGAQAQAVLDYLQDREMPNDETVYERRMLPVRLLETGRTVRAVAFVVNRAHASYCRPTAAAAAAAIARGIGRMGPNRDYLLNTVSHLRAMGVRDPGLDRIAALLPAFAVEMNGCSLGAACEGATSQGVCEAGWGTEPSRG